MKKFFETLSEWFFPVALILIVALVFLATPSQAEVVAEVSRPAIVIVDDRPEGGPAVVLVSSVVGPSSYHQCMGILSSFPAVRCFVPMKVEEKNGQQLFTGRWENAVAVMESDT